MVELKSSYLNSVAGHSGNFATSAETEWKLSDDGSLNTTLYAIQDIQSNLGRVEFFAFNSDSGDVRIQRRWTAVGQYGTDVIAWQNVTTLSASNFLTESQGGALLTLANLYKDVYFGGVTQTASTLKQYLDDMYGEHPRYFYRYQLGGDMYIDLNRRLATWDSGVSEYATCQNFPPATFNPNAGWTFSGPEYPCPADLSTVEDLCAFLIFGSQIKPQKLIFDVYVDGVIGEKGPQTVIKWRDNNSADDSIISHALVTPKIWGWPIPQPESPDIVSTPPIIIEDGIHVPNEDNSNYSRTQFNQSFEWSGEYSTPYVSLSNSMIGWRPMGDQIAFFGPDHICDTIRFYLRFDYAEGDGSWGDLVYVDIPYEYQGAAYIETGVVATSDKSKQYDTEVNIIGGLPPEDPELDPDEPEGGETPEGDPSGDGPYTPGGYEDLSDGEPTGFSGDAVLTTTYAMPKLTMQSVGADLWSQTYFNVLKIQNNPIENIISCKWYPMSLSGTPDTPIKIGDVTLGVAADKISTMYVKSFGSYKHVTTSGRPGYLSMTPYCVIKLHLPYVGVVQLDATEIYKRTLTGKYIVDLITGDVLVMLYLDGNPYMSLTGKMGVDIPLTSSNRVQTELAAASRAIGAVTSASNGNMTSASNDILSIMGMDYSSQRCTSHSPACCTYENLWIFIEVQYNPSKVSAGYKSQRGLPAHLYQTLQYMKNAGGGFVQIDGRTTINVAMTDEENRMLEQIMTTGFYL